MTKDTRYVVACAAAIAFALAYVTWGALGLPTLWYLPRAHAWAFSPGGSPAMGWYGHLLGASLFAICAAAIAAVTFRRGAGTRAVSCASVALIGAYLIAIAFVLR
jgi:hypothetical protein